MKLNQNHQFDEVRRSRFGQLPVTVAPLALALLGGSFAILPQAIAQAEPRPDHLILAQRVYQGLPPPPSARYREREYDPRQERAGDRYLVYINSDSPLLLDMIHKVAPNAFVREYRGRDVIQAGVFNQEFQARRLVDKLASEYINANIATLRERRERPQYVYYDRDEQRFDRRFDERQYLVVIPAREPFLPLIEDRVRQLAPGVPCWRGAFQREEPRGSHVAVGPFLDRSTAERWKDYLQDFGLRNARVYYGR